MSNQVKSESDPRYHTQKIKQELDDLIDHLRADIRKVDEPQARALFEVSAEVLGGLKKSFEHYEQESEKAWK